MTTEPIGYSDLNSQQRIKCAKFISLVGDEEQSVKLTLLLQKAGENTFKNVWSKLQMLTLENESAQLYDDELYNVFNIDEAVTLPAIINKVSTVRRRLKLPTYLTNLSQNCLNDFLKLFIVETQLVEVPTRGKDGTPGVKKVKGSYKPQFKLKPVTDVK